MISEREKAELFAGNQLLSTLDADTREGLSPIVDILRLEAGDVLLKPGQAVTHSVFPVGRTTVSLVVDVDDRKGVEVASIGREGAVGGIVSCGDVPAFSRAEVIVSGMAAAIPLHALESTKSNSPHLRNLFCRYADFLLAQIMQSAACNSFHAIEARTARWLLTAADRAGPKLDLTQDALARLLGAQRTTVNAVVGELEKDGLIDLRRGSVEIADRAGLEARSCCCYRTVARFFDDVIGDTGKGSFNGA